MTPDLDALREQVATAAHRRICEGAREWCIDGHGDCERVAAVVVPIVEAALLDAADERDAELRRLSTQAATAERDRQLAWRAMDSARAEKGEAIRERDALAAAVERVRALHVEEHVYIGPGDPIGGLICRACGEPVESEPCPTVRALDGEAERNFDKVLAKKLADPEFRRAFEDAEQRRALDGGADR